jgi:hypothetical protein
VLMMKGYANVVPLAYVILMSLLSFDMSDCTPAAIDEINNNNNILRPFRFNNYSC